MISFSTVAQLILESTVKGYEREEFLNLICDRAYRSSRSDKIPDLSNFNKWVNGTGQRNGFKIVNEYYRDPASVEGLAEDIETLLLDSVSDLPKLLEGLENAADEEVREGFLSLKRKKELFRGSEAEQLAKWIQFAITQRRDGVPVSSPDVGMYFTGTELPRSNKAFVGRERELERMERGLQRESVLFLTGIRGTGKTALALEYAKRMGKKYKNCVFIRYKRSVKGSIMALCVAEEMEQEYQTTSFEWRFERFRRLKSDSLLILDGMDVPPEEDDSFDLLFELHCHVLVTTHLQVDENSLFVGTLNEQSELLELFYAHCPKELAEDEEEALRLVELVHRHTYAVVMLALTVKSGCITAATLRNRLIEKGLGFPNDIKIRTVKDGKRLRKPFFDLMQELFVLQNLTEEQKRTMMNLTLMPAEGIDRLTFLEWSGDSAGVLLDLICLGWVQEEGKQVYLHGLIREMVIETFHPTVSQCRPLVNRVLELGERYIDSDRFSYREHDRLVMVNESLASMMTAVMEDTAECAIHEMWFTMFSHLTAMANYQALLSWFGSQIGPQDVELVTMLMLSTGLEAYRNSAQYLRFMRGCLQDRSVREGVSCTVLYDKTEAFLQEYVKGWEKQMDEARRNYAQELMNRSARQPFQLQYLSDVRRRQMLRIALEMNRPRTVVVAEIEGEGKHAKGRIPPQKKK